MNEWMNEQMNEWMNIIVCIYYIGYSLDKANLLYWW